MPSPPELLLIPISLAVTSRSERSTIRRDFAPRIGFYDGESSRIVDVLCFRDVATLAARFAPRAAAFGRTSDEQAPPTGDTR